MSRGVEEFDHVIASSGRFRVAVAAGAIPSRIPPRVARRGVGGVSDDAGAIYGVTVAES